MKIVTAALAVLLALVHAELWFGDTGVPRVFDLRERMREQDSANQQARLRNAQLVAEVRDLREGLEMVEEKARAELGMIKPDEILVQVSPAR